MKAFVTLFFLITLSFYLGPSNAGSPPDTALIRLRVHTIESFSDTALAFQNEKEFKKALNYYDKAMNYARLWGDSAQYAGILMNSAMIHKNQGKYEDALDALLLASKYFEDLYNTYNDSALLISYASCLNSLGDLHKKVGQNVLVLGYYKEALRRYKDSADIASSYNNIGVFYSDNLQYDSAISYLNKALAIKRKLRETDRAASTLLNMAKVYLNKKDTNIALHYLEDVIYNDSFNTDKQSFSEACTEMAMIRLNKKSYNEAIRLAYISLKYAEENEVDPLRLKNYDVLSRAHEAKGDPEKAIKYYRAFDLIKSRIMNKEKAEAIGSKTLQDQLDLAAHERESHQKENTIRDLKQQGLIVILVLSFLSLFLTLRSMLKEKRSKKKIELLMRELNHRVKNNFQTLKSLLNIQQDKITSYETKSVVMDIGNRIQAMIQIHARLYSDSNITAIPFDDYIRDIVSELAYTYSFDEKNVRQTLVLDKVSINIDKAIPLGLMVNEIISNAFKHAYRFVEDPALTIKLSAVGASAVILDIADNGKNPLQVNMSSYDSFGIRLIHLLAKQLKAQVDINTEEGTCFTISIEK